MIHINRDGDVIHWFPPVQGGCMEHSPLWKVKETSAAQDTARPFRNPKVQCSFHKCPIMVPMSIWHTPSHYISLTTIWVNFSFVRPCIVILLSVNCSTCFGWFLHPSSGAQITVSTISVTGQSLLLPVGIVEELRLICVCCTQHTQISLNSVIDR